MKTARSVRRKEAKRLRKRQERDRAERWNKIKKWMIWTIPASFAVLGALGSAATLHGYYKSRLSISPETSSINSSGLQMPIKVSNEGILAVNDVRFECIYKHTEDAYGNGMDNITMSDFPTQNVAELAPGHPVTLFCQGPGRGAIEAYTPNRVDLEIHVTFRPSFYFWQKSDVFQLAGVRGPDGIFHWMPY